MAIARVPMQRLKLCFYSLAILLIGAVLRSYGLMAEPAGFEEISASLAASKGFAGYLHSPQLDLCPPLYYAVLRPLAQMGGALWLMRLPSVVAGALAGLALYLMLRGAYGNRAAAIAGLLLAVNPLHISCSREAQPAALFSLVLVLALALLLGDTQKHRLRKWALYDLCAVALILLHRWGGFVVGILFLLHLSQSFFFRDPGEQRRMRIGRLLAPILYNYFLIYAVCAPWFLVMPADIPWITQPPDFRAFARILTDYYPFGMSDGLPLLWKLIFGVIVILLIPPFFKTLKQIEFPSYAAISGLLLGVLVPFLYSYADRARFSPQSDSVTMIAFFALTLGVMLGRCNIYARTVLVTAAAAMCIFTATRNTASGTKLDLREIQRVVTRNAAPRDVIVFWPDYALTAGEYFFGNKYTLVPAGDLFELWGELPLNQNIYFVIIQFPSRGAHLYTFPGALRQYSKAEILWSSRRNAIVRARDLNRSALQLWYDNPEKLNIVDAPTSDTLFNFTADNRIFRNENLFHVKYLDMCYELDGRRTVWTATDRTDLSLSVSLQPGSYLLKLHCSPVFDQIELGKSVEDYGGRPAATVTLRTGEQMVRPQIKEETVISRPFTTETELRYLPVHIEVTPMIKASEPRPMNFGIKIYSISIDQAPGAEEM